MELQGSGAGAKRPLRKTAPSGRRSGTGGPQVRKSGTFDLLQVGFGKSSRLILAAFLFAASTWWALTRFSRPDPFRKPAVLSWAWWTHPLEVNAPARLPVVSGTLTSAAVADKGAVAYVAGQQGLLLRYQASSQVWERLVVPDSLAVNATAAPSAATLNSPTAE